MDDFEILTNDVAEEPKQKVKTTRRSNGPSPFEVSLTNYPNQPWISNNVKLNQWFNYGLNPVTWSRYCLKQMNSVELNK
jgi:hypothetical protein